MITMDRLEAMQGADVYDSDGDKIGAVEEIFVDEQSNRPEWIGLGTGFFRTKRVLVPAETAEIRADAISVPYSKDQVKDTPDIDDDRIDQATEAALYRHYGLEYSERSSESGLPEGRRTDGADDVSEAGDSAESTGVTRSEEELRVGKREVETGRLRLHKWVETEEVEVPVEVKREKARITREPVDGSAGDASLGDESVEVTLTEEQPVVEKEVVAKERIGVETETETETETVRDEVRKEQVDVDEEGTAR